MYVTRAGPELPQTLAETLGGSTSDASPRGSSDPWAEEAGELRNTAFCGLTPASCTSIPTTSGERLIGQRSVDETQAECLDPDGVD